MKFKNAKVGQSVKVKVNQTNSFRFNLHHEGKVGTVIEVDPVDKDMYSIQVEFGEGVTDWGSHKGLKLVKD